jgi:hypothetical protein
MRAATRERMISIMAEAGLAGRLSATGSYRETGWGDINGDLPEADFWPRINCRLACDPLGVNRR